MGLRRKRARRRAPALPPPQAAERARSKPAAGRKRGSGSLLRRLVYWSLVLGVWAVIAAAGVIAFAVSTLPPIQSLEVPKRPPTVEIVGTDGRTLVMRGEMSGSDVSIKELPTYLPRAFVAIEDRRFFSHHGVDPIGLLRAAAANVLHRGVSQGGSTLTQQLAKNLFLTQQRTLWRKMQEAVLALWLEHKFSKTEILELYLNRVYFGSGAYGVEAAAQKYFGKPAREVKIAEAAMLAGLVKSPSRLAPSRNPNGAERRAQAVLAAMTELGFVTETMAKAALTQPARAVKPAGGSINYVADWIMDVLDDLVGRVDKDLVVETSIDPVLQAAAEQALVDELALKGQKFDVAQGAIVAVTPEGAVRAMVGGKNYAESQFNRAVAAKRQPGSAFKPFVYLTALERGLTPDSVREDKPVALKGWKPENYNREYHGPVTLTQALAHSLNTVSVRLTLEVGPAAVAKTAYRLGIASKLDANPSLALGTSEVSPLELTCAYAPFANGGNAIAPHVVERVRTRAGKIVYARAPQPLGRIIEPRYVAMMNAMLRETLVSGTAQKAQFPGWPAAGKTGTSQDFRDAWFIGYTGHLVTGVWAGNDDSSPTKKATGGSLPVDVWSRFMRAAHQGVAVASLPGLAGNASFASALPNAASLNPASEGQLGPQAGSQGVRPQPIDRGLDGWFLDRLFGRR
ncbi:MAG: PBP1A family penicillin-binding protein [Alphaproteobacteria bacterium]|nr:MAG: PBP1A family penicillin-binding protein [Alphaproteobacteria bacterium]